MSLIPELWDIIVCYLQTEVAVFRILEARDISPELVKFIEFGPPGMSFEIDGKDITVGEWKLSELTPHLQELGLVRAGYDLGALVDEFGDFRPSCMVCCDAINVGYPIFYDSKLPLELT